MQLVVLLKQSKIIAKYMMEVLRLVVLYQMGA